MGDRESVKKEINGLLEKYEHVVEEKRVSKYNEEMTKKDFILPLFRALGWNVEDSEEVTAEEKISKKRVDYGFRINGIPKFFLEAKSLKEDLNNPEFIAQAINYAWLKGCTWAVLTDFESVKIFNAEVKTANPLQSNLKTIYCHEFLERFNELWLLSRESFEEGLLDKEAEKWGKKTKKTPVDKQLLADFTRFRELLSKNVTKLNQNKNLTEEDLDESIQRLLDRLIFIRNCEDREIEAKVLISNLREWESKGKGQLIKELRNVFKYFDKTYDSKIFRTHLCDDLNIDNEVLHEIIEGLYYTKDHSISYDFSAIEADVLGNIYEQYLGHILRKTEKRAKLEKDSSHRKEQGIYYTPTYIVDYIVKNTIGEVLKNKKVNAEKIRVLDPACGSGSFLIKAFDFFNSFYNKKKDYNQTKLDGSGRGVTYSTKLKILKNNIFGVDLDKQAVEVAELNLLLKVAEKGQMLPLLQENIKCGNSLIDDDKVAGDKAFKWEEKFSGIMKEGGFDVVIGNPPYVFTRDVEFQESFKKYVQDNYFKGMESVSKSHARQSGKVNLYAIFLIKSIKLLKKGGLFGFIIPNNLLRTTTYDIIRKFILDNCRIKQIFDLGEGVFEGVTASTIILILEKEDELDKRNKNKVIIHTDLNDLSKRIQIEQKEFLNNTSYAFNITVDKEERKIFDSIEKNTIQLGEIVIIHAGGIATGPNKNGMIEDHKKNEKYKPMLEGKDIKPYYPIFANRYILYERKLLYRPRDESIFLSPEKLVTQRIGGGSRVLVVSYDNQKFYTFNSTNIILSKNNNFQLKFLVALLNSKLINWYYVNKFTNKSSLTVNISKTFLEKLPIKIVSESQLQVLIKLVDKLLFLNKRLNEIGGKKTDEYVKIKEEIKQIDIEINEFVYKIYRITRAEIKTVEGCFNYRELR